METGNVTVSAAWVERLQNINAELLTELRNARDKMFRDAVHYNQQMGAGYDLAAAHATTNLRSVDEAIAKATNSL